MPVLQSGSITPNHLVKWVAPGVIGDAGGPQPLEQVLGYLEGNFNTTSDQPIPIPRNITAFALTRIIVTNALIALSVAAGGFYSGAGKTGSTIVAAGQAYSTLTLPTSLINPTLTSAGSGTRFSATNLTAIDADYWELFLSLTTPQGATATADVYLVGVNLTR